MPSKQSPVSFVSSAARAEDFPPGELPEVALVGRSNVGKSTLLNRLTGVRRLAFVSKTPGRTQLINFFRVGNRCQLVDLPGYGYARVPARVRRGWEDLVTSYLFHREQLRLVLLLVDARREPVESDLEVRDLLVEQGIDFALVITKADKLSRNRMAQNRARLERAFGKPGNVPILTFSAVTNEGRKELWMVIEKHAREPRPAPKK